MLPIPGARLEAVNFEALSGFAEDDHLAAFRCFRRSADALVGGATGPRAARAPSTALRTAAREALSLKTEDAADARRFFETRFRPFRIIPEQPASPHAGPENGFLTGYYEPIVPASFEKTARFRWPLLARPADLVTLAPGEAPPGFPEGVTGARRLAGGTLVPYPDRKSIERAQDAPLVWVEDAVEAFLIHVQGSAQLAFAEGARARLAYDGRNGLPYTSIGRILIETGAIPEPEMSLARLKGWLRAAGLGEGDRGLELMRRNRSFIFFRLVKSFDPALGPVAGAGVPLTPLRSLAVDRTAWSYGLPFWIEAGLPTGAFRRLMIAQDTGSAIVGPARGDIFFGSGDEAGAQAGSVRHPGALTALIPLGELA